MNKSLLFTLAGITGLALVAIPVGIWWYNKKDDNSEGETSGPLPEGLGPKPEEANPAADQSEAEEAPECPNAQAQAAEVTT